AKGFGIMKASQRFRYHALSAAHAIGTSGTDAILAINTAPGLNWYCGPDGPSAVVTIDTFLFMAWCMSRSTRAPVWFAEPRMTCAPQARAIRAGTSPSTDAETRKQALNPRRIHSRIMIVHRMCCWCQ